MSFWNNCITTGPDGSLWFTQEGNQAGHELATSTTGGVITQFDCVLTCNNGLQGLGSIAAGSDGNLWATELANGIARITTAGEGTSFPLPAGHTYGQKIVSGPGGNLWFTELSTNQVSRISTAGVLTAYAIPTPGSNPTGIAAGPDGNVWFTEYQSNKIGRITSTGVVTEFAIPTSDSFPSDIVAGSDGNLWFTEFHGNKIGRITVSGVISEFPIPTAFALPAGITAGPDGNIWFAETRPPNSGVINQKIGRVALSKCVADGRTLCLGNGRLAVTADFQRTPEGPSAPATAVTLTGDSGYFWFFDPTNIELVVKALTACRVNGEYWVFAGGLTDVGVEVKVIDTVTGALKAYSNPAGVPFQPIQDSSAFPCP